MILRAKIDHCKECIRILTLAMDEIANFISGTKDESATQAILEDFFKMQNNRISYQNVLIKEIDGDIAGAVCFYDTKLSSILDEPINKRLTKIGATTLLENECFGDGLYIDSIAVDENYRRQGVAEELICAVFDCASQKRINSIYLSVSKQKEKTKKYYEKFGFEKQDEILLYGAKFDYMIKNL